VWTSSTRAAAPLYRRLRRLEAGVLGTFWKIMELHGYFNFKADCQQLLLFYYYYYCYYTIAPQGDAFQKGTTVLVYVVLRLASYRDVAVLYLMQPVCNVPLWN